ncbi:MAG: hypothetical protein K8T89_19430 [Planctomycetes bacterium]|nr:hypothetical protein [Planctomycetota bacterium]
MMRPLYLLGIGILEALLASAFLVIGWFVPSPKLVVQSFDRLGNVTQGAEKQVDVMRSQVGEVRTKDFPEIMRQIKDQTATVSTNVRDSRIDFDAVAAMSNSLDAVAKGLQSWSATLDADKYGPTINMLLGAADLIDHQTTTTAALKSLRTIDRSAAINRSTSQKHSSEPHQDSPLRVQRESVFKLMSSGMSSTGGSKLEGNDRLAEMRAGFRELEYSLGNAIRQVDVVSSATYPHFQSTGGLQPSFEMRSVWPEGKQTADGLRKAHASLQVANKELDLLASAIAPLQIDFAPRPQPNENLDRFLDKQRDIDFERLHEAAASLRKMGLGVATTLRSWPELVETMHRSAIILNGSRKQLDSVLAQRVQYEKAMHGSERMTQNTMVVLDSYSTKLDARLSEQEHALRQMHGGLGEINSAIPSVARTTGDFLRVIRWLFWLSGALIGVHGLFVVGQAYVRR